MCRAAEKWKSAARQIFARHIFFIRQIFLPVVRELFRPYIFLNFYALPALFFLNIFVKVGQRVIVKGASSTRAPSTTMEGQQPDMIGALLDRMLEQHLERALGLGVLEGALEIFK